MSYRLGGVGLWLGLMGKLGCAWVGAWVSAWHGWLGKLGRAWYGAWDGAWDSAWHGAWGCMVVVVMLDHVIL